jgi:hypothetical protein
MINDQEIASFIIQEQEPSNERTIAFRLTFLCVHR